MTIANHFIEVRKMLENVYVVNQDGELFRIQDMTVHPKSIFSLKDQATPDLEPGCVLRQMKNSDWQEFEIPEDMKDTMSQDPEIVE